MEINGAINGRKMEMRGGKRRARSVAGAAIGGTNRRQAVITDAVMVTSP